ncbi:MAG: alpha/beta hydrolase-fold protein [Bacteroidota bacterium]
MNFWSQPIRTLYSLLAGKAPLLRQIRHWASSSLQREVDIDIYLPPDYFVNRAERYPLLIFNDGQDLHVMEFAHILEQLYLENAIPYMIVVGIYAGHERMREYGVARQADYKGRGDLAGNYQHFIMQELLPLLHQRFRCKRDAAQTAFAGFSLGALSALDIAWANPEIFGRVGVFSGALWWRWSEVDPRDPDADRIMHEIIQQTNVAPNRAQRFWFQCGTQDETDDRNHNGVIDAIDDTLDLIKVLKIKGFPDDSIRYLEIEGGEHNPRTWGEAMPDFLTWIMVD